MKKFVLFLSKLKNEYFKNELYYLGNELTYKILMSIFPLLLLIIYVFTFINVDYLSLFQYLDGAIPSNILNTLRDFAMEQPAKHGGEISSGLLISGISVCIYSSSSGFLAIIRGINKSYGVEDKRNFLYKRIISMLLVILFLTAICTSLILMIFGDALISFVEHLGLVPFAPRNLLNFIRYLTSIVVIVVTIMFIYKISCVKKIPILSTLPGSIVTLLFWIISSKLFNIYVNNYSSYSNLYGGIGSIFILVLWINIIAIVLLMGSQINAILYENEWDTKVIK